MAVKSFKTSGIEAGDSSGGTVLQTIMGTNAADIRLMRGATEIARPGTAAAYTQNTNTNYIGSVSISYLDEPATTSATTYKTQFNSGDNSGNSGVQKSGARSTIILQEIKI
jgi:hypothetical protein